MITLPYNITCGYWDCSEFENLTVSPKRKTTRFEIEFYLEDGLSTFADNNEYIIKKHYIQIAKPNQVRYSNLPFKTMCLKFSVEGDIAERLKAKGARRIFIFSTFGLFVEGFDKFDEYYAKGYIDKIFTTNLIYNPPELLEKELYCNVNMSKYIALLIDTLNCDNSISELLNPIERIKTIVDKYNNKEL